MAGHLQRGGHDVTVFNRTASRAEAWVAEYGGRAAATPREAAADADIVCACVGADHDVREVTVGDDGRVPGHEGRRRVRGPHDCVRGGRARVARGGTGPRPAFHRRPGVRWPGWSAEGTAERDVRRRCRAVRTGRAGAAHVRQVCRPHWRQRRRAALQDGQPGVHRRTRAGSGRRTAFRAERRPRRARRPFGHLQGRRAVVADGEPLADDGRRQVRVRLRGGLDAQGPRHRARGGAPQRLAPACGGARGSVLCAGAGTRWRPLGHVEPDRAAGR